MRATQHRYWYTYKAMKERCNFPNQKDYHNYGGRGIKVCKRWSVRSGFWNFIQDMGERPDGFTLDRIDNNLGYSPKNCRWASLTQQRHNTRIYRTNKSGVRGVSFNKVTQKWFANIEVDGQRHNLGFHEHFEDAVSARKEAESRLLTR